MRFLLVGGSNCVVRGGYGAGLMAAVPGEWQNRSLGNSPSLRGVDELLAHPHEVHQADRIVFEYALNDLIFESSNTLDAATHAGVLTTLLADPQIAAKIVFVLLVGQGAGARVAAGQSFVVDHYRSLAAAGGVPLIDLMPLILGRAAEDGPAAVFVDNDHFSASMVERLVRATAEALAGLPAGRVAPPAGPARPLRLLRVDPLLAAPAAGVRAAEFQTSLLARRLAVLSPGAALEIESPGGQLVGWYARCSRDAGIVQVTGAQGDLLKSMRHRFASEKPFIALRHLTTPLPTRAGEKLRLRRVERLDDAPGAVLDATLAHVANGSGGEVAIGELLFLQPDAPSAAPAAATAVFVPSTLRHLHLEPPSLDATRTVARHARSPVAADGRVAEGGLRLEGRHKRSLPDLPLVTIVTVCLNSASTLGQTIDSVLRQTYPNIEYIVVDGASTDGTLDIVRAHAHVIDYFVSEPDTGLYAAMNKGLGLASGAYVLILNSDDWYEDDAVEALVAAQRYSGCDFVSALATSIDPQDRPAGVMRSMPFDDGVRLRMTLRHETMLVPAWAYNAVGRYDESYRICADFELTVRLFEAGLRHYEIPRAVLSFRVSGVSNSDNEGVIREDMRVLRRSFPKLDDAEIKLLADRQRHTGMRLLDVVERHADDTSLWRAVTSYVRDNAENGLRGRGRPQWREHAANILSRLHDVESRRSPLVSFVVPYFRAESTMARCLDSLLAQAPTDFEIVCVDDCSPDATARIVDAYRQRDPRVVSTVNPRNLGPGGSRNRGAQVARGSYIFFVDPDDEVPPAASGRLLASALAHRSELVRGAYRREQSHHGQTKEPPRIIHPLGAPQVLANVSLAAAKELLKSPEGHWCYLYRADLVRRHPYPTDLRIGEDAAFLSRLLPRVGRISVIADVVYHYLANTESEMNVFSMERYTQALEWRGRALQLLSDTGHRDLGMALFRAYEQLHWHDRFHRHYRAAGQRSELTELSRAVRNAYRDAGLPGLAEDAPARTRAFLQALLDGEIDAAEAAIADGTAMAESVPAGASASASAPLVSVILPFFKAEQTIRRSLESLLAQTYRHFEVVCVNDTSPDGSQAIVDEFQRRDARLRVVRNPKNVGHGASRNRGIDEARGAYIFHIDPDDEVPPHALQVLCAAAVKHGSDMVKGSFLHEQSLFGAAKVTQERRGLKPGSPPVVATDLRRSPELLKTTEGHWSYLYRTGFARSVRYPTDLKMGQDSIFLVEALVAAKSVTIVPEVVYHYRVNPSSAMNTFTFRKFRDSLEWRRRAWHVLSEHDFKSIGDRLLLAYWSDAFFKKLSLTATPDELQSFLVALRSAFAEAGVVEASTEASPFVRSLFGRVLGRRDDAAIALMSEPLPAKPPARVEGATAPPPLRVAVLCTTDRGGAATGSHRRIDALIRRGVAATLHVLQQSGGPSYVRRITAWADGLAGGDGDTAWRDVQRLAIAPAREVKGFRARELFSLARSVVDFRKLKPTLDAADVVHLHWVVGMFDYAHAEVLADKPVVWTLADMNAFTGGCHYSEGCEGYRKECGDCPLLGGESDLAHEAWKTKQSAYAKLKNLHIVCPSQWMADRVAQSSLLGNRPIHVIPNGFPTDRIAPTDRLVARVQLGLPLQKKLLLFGADSLTNRRKGGAWLGKALQVIAKRANDVEVVLFGSGKIELPLKVNNLGPIADETRLALAYSAADAFVFPSIEDNAPLTVGESLLCGTPVVAFPVGNVRDLVIHLETGYVAKMEDSTDLARGIDWCLEAEGETAIRRSLRCRLAAAEYHDPLLAADRHIALYRKVVAHG